MPTRPIGFGPAVQNALYGSPPAAPKVGQAKPAVPNVIEAANVIRSQARAGNLPAQIPKRKAPTVTRGRFSVPGRGTGRTLMFNPNDVSDTKGINYGSIEVPGASHPVYQFGAGGERLISFDLYVDGDRGRFGRQEPRAADSLSIMDELMWYRSLVYPTAYGQSYAQVAPYTVLFTFGELYNNMPCIVKKADWKINYWVPGQSGPIPVRATIPLQLAEITDKSVTADQILSAGGLTSYEF